MERIQLSEEELAVISEMRRTDRAGMAIFRYAMSFDSDVSYTLDRGPFSIPPGDRP